MRLDHVGVATDDAAGLIELFTGLLNASVSHEETFDGMDIVFLDAGGCELELLDPMSEETPVARFLERNGPGLHHLAFRVDDVAGSLETAAGMDLERLDESPRPGARGHRVAFLHPRSCGGILVELVEP